LKKGILDLIAHTPRDEIVYLHTRGEPVTTKDISAQMPNLRALRSTVIPLPAASPEPNLDGDEKILPSLQHIFLEELVIDSGDWSPLMTFLAHRASSGNRLGSLTIDNSPYVCLEVQEGIRRMVQELRIQYLSTEHTMSFSYLSRIVVTANTWPFHSSPLPNVHYVECIPLDIFASIFLRFCAPDYR